MTRAATSPNLYLSVEGAAVADQVKSTSEPTGPAVDTGSGEAQAPSEPAAGTPAQTPRKRRVRRSSPGPYSVTAVTAHVRNAVATVVFAVAALAALVLVLGAVLTALGANEDNVLVAGVLALAGWLQGPFADVFTFADAVKQRLVNWGIAAAVYLVVGRVAERLIRP